MMRPRPWSSERAPAIIALLTNVNTKTAHTRWEITALRPTPVAAGFTTDRKRK